MADESDDARYFDLPAIQEFYGSRLARFGIGPKAVAWADEAGHTTRLKVIMDLTDFRGRSVLDAGCGLTDLHRALMAAGVHHSYLGVDSSIDLLRAAQTRDPAVRVVCADIEAFQTDDQFDVVVASGLFFLQPPDFRARVLRKLYGQTREILIYNLVSSRGESTLPPRFRNNPVDALAEAFALNDAVTFRHDYLPHDFTISVRRT